MNKNFYGRSSRGKLPSGLFVIILIALLGFSGAAVLIPFVIIVSIVVNSFVKNFKDGYNSVDKYDKKTADSSINEKIKEINNIKYLKNIKTITTITNEDEMNSLTYRNKPESEKRLEMYKNLYDNGFMEKDEFEEKRKKLKGSN